MLCVLVGLFQHTLGTMVTVLQQNHLTEVLDNPVLRSWPPLKTDRVSVMKILDVTWPHQG